MQAQILTSRDLKHGKINGVRPGKGTLRFLYLLSKQAIQWDDNQLYCRRCDCMLHPTESALQIEGMYFCPYCLSFGRLTTKDNIYYRPFFPANRGKYYLNWQGKLSSFQKNIAQSLVQYRLKEKELMVYAVTGAGKIGIYFIK